MLIIVHIEEYMKVLKSQTRILQREIWVQEEVEESGNYTRRIVYHKPSKRFPSLCAENNTTAKQTNQTIHTIRLTWGER